jgi:hypothetical protein
MVFTASTISSPRVVGVGIQLSPNRRWDGPEPGGAGLLTGHQNVKTDSPI